MPLLKAQCNPSADVVSPKGGYVKRCSNPSVVVFVHGLDSNPEVWRNADNGAYWPKLIADDTDPAFGNTDVYVAGYDSSRGGRMNMSDLLTQIFDRLMNDEVFESHRQVVFVGHSMGGLLIQQFLLTYSKEDLAKKVPAIFLYGTPQEGSHVANWASHFTSGPLVKELESGENNFILHDVDQRWTHARFTIKRYCAYEKLSEKGFKVVGSYSATSGCDDKKALNTDHHHLVEPADRSADAYIFLRNKFKTEGYSSVKIEAVQPTPLPAQPASAPNPANSVQTLSPYAEIEHASAISGGMQGDWSRSLLEAGRPLGMQMMAKGGPRPEKLPDEFADAFIKADQRTTLEYEKLRPEILKANQDALSCMQPTPNELRDLTNTFNAADKRADATSSVQDVLNYKMDRDRFMSLQEYFAKLQKELGSYHCNRTQ